MRVHGSATPRYGLRGRRPRRAVPDSPPDAGVPTGGPRYAPAPRLQDLLPMAMAPGGGRARPARSVGRRLHDPVRRPRGTARQRVSHLAGRHRAFVRARPERPRPARRAALLDVTVADGRGAAARAAALDADLWIPDDAAWRGAPDRLALADAPPAGAVLATSPVYLVSDADTAARITEAGGGWNALAGLVTAPGSRVRLVAHEPGASGDGLLALGAVGEAVWLADGMDASADALSVAFPRTRIVAAEAPRATRSTGRGRPRHRAGAAHRRHHRSHGHRTRRPHGTAALQLVPLRRRSGRPRPREGPRRPPGRARRSRGRPAAR